MEYWSVETWEVLSGCVNFTAYWFLKMSIGFLINVWTLQFLWLFKISIADWSFILILHFDNEIKGSLFLAFGVGLWWHRLKWLCNVPNTRILWISIPCWLLLCVRLRVKWKRLLSLCRIETNVRWNKSRFNTINKARNDRR